MKNRMGIIAAFIFSFIIFQATFLYAQSSGVIIRTATALTGRTVLDPNGDGYTSATTTGFGSSDVTNSEIPYRVVPSFSVEPFGDLRRGPNHLYSDFVPDAGDDGVYGYYNGTNWLFRFRLGSIMPGSKGYSILIDTDGKFGASGANADPNYQPETTGVNGNPGFEIEIVLETNFRIAIYNVDGSSSPTLIKAYTNWKEMSQISLAGTYDNGDPDFFMDFYIPFSDLQAAPFNLTTSSPLRFSATTVMAPKAAIGGPKSDIYGLTDAGYKTTNEQYEAYINAQPSFTIGTLQTGSIGAMCTAPPVVNSPVGTGTVSISGTWTKSSLNGAGNSATITVYVDGASVGTIPNVASGSTWTLPNVSLTDSKLITAKAQAAGESMCLVSNTVIASNCTAANRPASPVLTCANNYGKGVSGNNLSTGWVVYVENLTRGTVETSTANSGQFTTSGTSPNITWNYAGGCNGGPNMPSGTYKIYYMNGSGCVSEPIFFCLATSGGSSNNLAGTAATPIITSPVALTPGTNSITGTGEANSTTTLYVNGAAMQTVTASGSGAFAFTNLSLSLGQQVYITNVLNTGTINTSKCFATSSVYTVNCYTTAPIINADNNKQTTAGSPITGISSEPSGTVIRIYTPANTLVATTNVQANGTWSTGNAGTTPATYNGISATAYYATAQNGTCNTSVSSDTITAVSPTGSARCGTINGPVSATAPNISGTITGAVASTTINLYLDGVLIGTTTTSGTAWGPITVNTNRNDTLFSNGVLMIGVQESGKGEVLCSSSATTITCTPSPAAPIISPTNTTIAPNQSVTYTISNAVAGTFYGIAENTTGQSLADGVWATTNGNLSITTNAMPNQGVYNISVKSTTLSGISVCSTPASASMNVSSTLPVQLISFTGKLENGAAMLKWISEQEMNLSKYEIEYSSNAADFSKVGEQKAAGKTARMNYQFQHSQTSYKGYYRLKLMEADGTFSYSKTIVLSRNFTVSLHSVSPNPFTGSISVRVLLQQPQPLKLLLQDEIGKLIRLKNVIGQQGENIISMNDLQHLSRGLYTLQLVTGDEMIPFKIIKVD